jgi:hypothetical protein
LARLGSGRLFRARPLLASDERDHGEDWHREKDQHDEQFRGSDVHALRFGFTACFAFFSMIRFDNPHITMSFHGASAYQFARRTRAVERCVALKSDEGIFGPPPHAIDAAASA